MDHSLNDAEEKLREASCNGDLETVQELVTSGVNVNSQNSVNGWTSLHWAVKRGHRSVIAHLLAVGADKNLMNANSQTAAEMTEEQSIHDLLKAENVTVIVPKLPITPHYLNHPEWPYNNKPSSRMSNVKSDHRGHVTPHFNHGDYVHEVKELVLKVRVANSDDRDFYEVELDTTSLTYDALLSLMCSELNVEKHLVNKIRKLPDTVVRKDKDIKRLTSLQELELVLSNKFISASSRNYGMMNAAGVPASQHERILY